MSAIATNAGGVAAGAMRLTIGESILRPTRRNGDALFGPSPRRSRAAPHRRELLDSGGGSRGSSDRGRGDVGVERLPAAGALCRGERFSIARAAGSISGDGTAPGPQQQSALAPLRLAMFESARSTAAVWPETTNLLDRCRWDGTKFPLARHLPNAWRLRAETSRGRHRASRPEAPLHRPARALEQRAGRSDSKAPGRGQRGISRGYAGDKSGLVPSECRCLLQHPQAASALAMIAAGRYRSASAPDRPLRNQRAGSGESASSLLETGAWVGLASASARPCDRLASWSGKEECEHRSSPVARLVGMPRAGKRARSRRRRSLPCYRGVQQPGKIDEVSDR